MPKLIVFPQFEIGQSVRHRHGETQGIVCQVRIGPNDVISYTISWPGRDDSVHWECELTAEEPDESKKFRTNSD